MSKIRKKKYYPIREGNYILYPFGEVIDYQSYNDNLFRILSQNHLSPFLSDGRIRFNDGRDNSKYWLSDLAYACYSCGVVSFDTWRNDIQTFLDRKHGGGYQIDHADSNVHNNTILNLSMMDGEANRSKASKVARFKPPSTVVVAYVAGEYRVHVEWAGLYVCLDLCEAHMHGEGGASLNLLCSDEWALASCLDELSTLETDWSYPAKIKRTWQYSEKENPYSNARVSISAQERIADMERGEFDPYTEGQLKEYLKLVGLKTVLIVGEAHR